MCKFEKLDVWQKAVEYADLKVLLDLIPEVKNMPRVTLDLSVEEIKTLVFQLPARELLALVDAIEEGAETVAMMQLAESGFQEWNEEGEDIYDAEA